MAMPVRITFRGVAPSEPVRQYAARRAEKLEQLAERIVSCRIAIEGPHRHKLHGGHYRVRIDVVVPGAEIVIGRRHELRASHQDAYAAIDDAFESAARKLAQIVRRRGEHHPPLRRAS